MTQNKTDFSKMKPLVIQFSGGKTSGFMTKFLTEYYQGREIHVLFQNTGKEHEETLKFVNECDKRWNLNVVWLEAVIRTKKVINGRAHIFEINEWESFVQRRIDKYARKAAKRLMVDVGISFVNANRLAMQFKQRVMDNIQTLPCGTRHRVVNFETASRNGKPYEDMMKRYGIPNMVYTHCTRELKINVGQSYIKNELKLEDWEIAIGIRTDEMHRINRVKTVEYKTVYPLVDLISVNKTMINQWWAQQDFNLNLDPYLGNCDMCFKKSIKHLVSIVREQPERALWWEDMEKKYALVNRTNPEEVRRFFRKHKSVQDLRDMVNEKPSFFETPKMTEEFDCVCKST